MKAIWRFPERGALAALLILLCLYIAPHVSFAHAYPEHADPKVGSMVAVAPSVVRIWFDSALEPLFSTISVKNQSGEIVDKGDGRVDASDPTLLEASVPPLPSGTYRVIWDVVARDGHRTTGNFSFTIK